MTVPILFGEKFYGYSNGKTRKYNISTFLKPIVTICVYTSNIK